MDSSSLAPPNQTQSAESSLADVYWWSVVATREKLGLVTAQYEAEVAANKKLKAELDDTKALNNLRGVVRNGPNDEVFGNDPNDEIEQVRRKLRLTELKLADMTREKMGIEKSLHDEQAMSKQLEGKIDQWAKYGEAYKAYGSGWKKAAQRAEAAATEEKKRSEAAIADAKTATDSFRAERRRNVSLVEDLANNRRALHEAKQHSSTLEVMLEKEKMRADAAEAVMEAEKNCPDAPRTPQTRVVPKCSCGQCYDADEDEDIHTEVNRLEHRADAAETKLALETKRADAAEAALATEKERADAAESALAQEKGHAEVALFAFSQQKDRADAAEASLGHNDEASETTVGSVSGGHSNPDISIN